MDEPTLFPVPVELSTQPKLSPGARRTARQHAALEAGIHPAMGGPVGEGTCGECAFIQRIGHRNRTYLKCPKTRLGLSHSEASDIRASWPGCIKYVPEVGL